MFKTIVIGVLILTQPGGLTAMRAKEAFILATKHLERSVPGLKFKIRRRLVSSESKAIDYIAYHKADAYIIIEGPIYIGGRPYIGGEALLSCFGGLGSLGVVNAEEISVTGMSRFLHSRIAMEHELGHLGRMKHIQTWPPNVMDPAALAYVDAFPNLSFAKKSIIEMRNCLKKEHRA